MFPIEIDEDVQAAVAGELLLLQVSVRRSPAEIALLLHPDLPQPRAGLQAQFDLAEDTRRVAAVLPPGNRIWRPLS